ncbi:MAG: hypothetical protein AVDCRST_MAG89-4741, partial [uncultured Gemmatimonadetes bacterium]
RRAGDRRGAAAHRLGRAHRGAAAGRAAGQPRDPAELRSGRKHRRRAGTRAEGARQHLRPRLGERRRGDRHRRGGRAGGAADRPSL